MNKNKARPAVLSQGSFQLLEAHPEVSYMAAGGASHLQDAPSTCAARMWSGCPLPAYSIASTFNVCFQINCPVFATLSVSLMNVIARVLFLVVRETCWLPGCSTAKPERCWASIFADLSLCAMDGPLKSYYESLTGPCFSSTE